MLPDFLQNYKKLYFVGADEVGYGCIAGPVFVGGVKAPKDWWIDGLNDSKQLTKKQRQVMRDKLMREAEDGRITWTLASRSNSEIDSEGIAVSLKACYEEVFTKFHCSDSLLIADGILKFPNLMARGYDIKSVIKADTLVPQVMAASILAKVHRDAIMVTHHQMYPEYDWDSNVGYPSPSHKAALKKIGVTPLHRMSYKPCAEAAASRG